MLETFAVSPTDERTYLALLHHPRATATVVAASLGRSVAPVRRSLQELERLGLASRLDGRPARFVATRPDIALDHLAERQTAQVARARTEATELLAALPPDARGREAPVEVISGRTAVAAVFTQIERSTQHELLVLDRPPYAQGAAQAAEAEDDLLDRGVHCRVIYAPEALVDPAARQQLDTAIDAGEEARMHPTVPMKLAISDRSVATLPVVLEESHESVLVVRTSSLLDALTALFDLLWELSVPVQGLDATGPASAAGLVGEGDGPEPGDQIDRELLLLLASGSKDEAVARQLGVSVRTVHRRTAALMEQLGCRTRFQAGMLARGRGLV